MPEIIYKELSYKIIGIAMEIHRELGYGYLEKVYENALLVLLKENNINAEQQKELSVNFRGHEVGKYIADIVIENKIILELKVATAIKDVHKAQVANYLKTTGLKLGIIINFGKDRLEYERVVF